VKTWGQTPYLFDKIPQNAELDFIDKETPVKISKKNNIYRVKVEHVFEPLKK